MVPQQAMHPGQNIPMHNPTPPPMDNFQQVPNMYHRVGASFDCSFHDVSLFFVTVYALNPRPVVSMTVKERQGLEHVSVTTAEVEGGSFH